MNSIITLKRLIELLSKASGASAEQSDAFIKAFTTLIRDTMVDGEEVSIKDIGRFTVTDDKRVAFTPEKELAEAINAPFSMFTPEEIAPDLTVEDIARAAKATTLATAEQVAESTEVKPAESPAEEAKPIEPTAAEQEPATQEPVEEKPAEAASAEEEVEPATVEPLPSEPKAIETEFVEPKPVEPKPVEPESVEPKPIEPKPVEPKPIEPKLVEPKPVEPTPPAMITAEKPCPIGPEPESNTTKQREQTPPRKAPVAPKIEYRANGAGGSEPVKQRPSALWLIWSAVIGILIGIAIGYFLHDPITKAIEPSAIPTEQPTEDQDSALIAEEVAVGAAAVTETDSVAEATTAPADTIAAPAPKAETAAATQSVEKWDTIRAGNSLGTMAKKHYGNNVYWVYIYLENESQIPNPNRISAGTRLKIPPLSKYATAATEEENKAAAQKKVNQILSKYPQ